MTNKVKYISIKNQTCYFSDDMTNIKNIDPNNFKIDEKLYKNILIHHIGYVTIKDSKYLKINRVNPLYFIINKLIGYFEAVQKSYPSPNDFGEAFVINLTKQNVAHFVSSFLILLTQNVLLCS